ncbi:hypothetical protein [Acinetobacter sp. AS167]|uniref:hypothetical protein n=1 Tax=Acinetobacter sp. AS167 TaxID=3127884 RepID=UPI003019C075
MHKNISSLNSYFHLNYLQNNLKANQLSLTNEQILQLDQLFAPDQIQDERYPNAGWTGIETA